MVIVVLELGGAGFVPFVDNWDPAHWNCHADVPWSYFDGIVDRLLFVEQCSGSVLAS